MSTELENKMEEGRYLCFSVAHEKFAIPLLQVKEVLGKLNFTAIPQSPAYFKGIVNLRGQVISVIDLQKKLHPATKTAEKPEITTIILDFGHLSLGISVDSVDSVREYKKEDLSPPPSLESSAKIEFIQAVAREKDGMVLLLNMAHLLNAEDHKILQTKKSA